MNHINRVRRLFGAALFLLFSLGAAFPGFSQTGEDEYDDDEDGDELAAPAPWFSLSAVEHPWSFGLQAGYTHNTLYQGGAEQYRTGEKWEGAGGWTVGLAARYQIFNWLAVHVEPSYTTKNYTWTGGLKARGAHYTDFNNTTNGFVDFPLLANLSAGYGSPERRIRVFANVGFFIGVWAYGNEQGETLILENTSPLFGTIDPLYAYDVAYEFDERRDNRFDGGLLFGLGVQFDVRAFSFIAECRYSYSLSDLQKKYQAVDFSPLMNDTWIVQAGVLFNPGVFFGGN
jgi:hypothetical protein